MKTIKLLLISSFLFLFFILFLSKILSSKINVLTHLNIYDNNNTLIYSKYGNIEGTWISLREIDPFILKAFLCVEDEEFYNHNGFNFTRIVKSTFDNLQTQSFNYGASTITQQYARRLYLSNEKTLKRKITEIDYTLQIESKYSKDEILEGYLNTLYYANNVYGIYDAAYYLFDKHVNELDIDEIAYLVGIIKAPNTYLSSNNINIIAQRQKLILEIFKHKGLITQSEYLFFLNKKTMFVFNKEEKGLINYYIDKVLNEYNDMKIETDYIEIHTPIDLRLYKAIEKLSLQNNELQTGIVAIEPNTGYVKAIIGGNDYQKTTYNRAINSKRQIGSTVKPFLYYLALKNGFTPITSFQSSKCDMYINNTLYSPRNYGDFYVNKKISMAYALATSDNIYAVKTHLFLGMNKLSTFLASMNFSETTPSAPLALGTCETSLLNLTSYYNAFASYGIHYEPRFIKYLKVDNETIEIPSDSKKIFDEVNNYIIVDLMTGMFDTKLSSQITGKNITKYLTRKYAGKSGLTDYDTYMIGFNPLITIGIWEGYDDNVYSSSYNTKYYWAMLIEHYLNGTNDLWFQKSNGITSSYVDPTGFDSGYKKELFFKETIPYI